MLQKVSVEGIVRHSEYKNHRLTPLNKRIVAKIDAAFAG
jgi:hypothetical protein